jgi:hypothetical protein
VSAPLFAVPDDDEPEDEAEADEYDAVLAAQS